MIFRESTDEREIHEELKNSATVPIYKGKGDNRYFSPIG